MDGVQIFRSGNMCDTPCGLAAQILALSWRSPTLIELLEAAERTFYVELSDVTVMAWLRTRPRRLWKPAELNQCNGGERPRQVPWWAG